MRLVETHIFTKDSEYYKELDRLAFLSKNLYNAGLYIIRQSFTKKTKTGKRSKKAKYLNYQTVYNIMTKEHNPDFYALPFNVAQQVLRKLDANWQGYFAAIKEFKKHPEKFNGVCPRIPNYLDILKGRNILTYTVKAIKGARSKEPIKDGIIRLTGNSISVPTKQQAINQVRIVPIRYGYKLEVVYTVEEPKQSKSKKVAAIDLGIDNLATLTFSALNNPPQIINGKPLKSINQYYNKERANIKSELEIKNKRKDSRKLQQLDFKRNNKVLDYLHKSSRYIINQLVSYGIGTLVIGYNPNWKQECDMGKKNNQKFVSIPHMKFVEQLEYKAKLAGIKVIRQQESYTSKCSLLDLESIEHHETYAGKRIHRGLFKSAKGYKINADVQGSYNIMRKAFPNLRLFNKKGIEAIVVLPVKRINPLTKI
jgi:putative transposase